MKKLAFLLLLFGAALCALGQGVSYTGTPIALTRGGFPAAGATVTVCAGKVSFNVLASPPCSPFATIYSDPALTNTITQPGFTADGLGNYPFFAPSGTYTVCLTGPGFIGNCTYWNAAIVSGGPASFKTLNQIRMADQYASIQAAVNDFGAPGNCGIVYIPQGTYTTNLTFNTSNTCTNPSNMLIIRGAGRRNTVLKPAVNACVITIDSTAGPVQGVTIEDLSIDDTGTGFSGANNNGICLTGENINDQHLFRRIFIQGGFTNDVNISGRCINCKFENDEFDSTGTGDVFSFYQNGNNVAGGGEFTISGVTINGSSSSGRCLYINSTPTPTSNVNIRDSVFQGCGQEGVNLNNITGLQISGSDFESNGASVTSDNILLGGTFMRGFQIYGGNQLLASTTGNAIEVTATQVAGVIEGNFLNSPTGKITVGISGNVTGMVQIGCNWEAFAGVTNPHNISPDGNNVYHGINTCANSAGAGSNNQSGTQTISVQNQSQISFFNNAPLTVSNFTGADPGQVVQVFNAGTSTISFPFSNTNGFYTPMQSTISLLIGESMTWTFNPTNGRWLPSMNGSSGAIRIQLGGGSGVAPSYAATSDPFVSDNLATGGSGSAKVYGVVGASRMSGDVAGDRSYAGWFKATAANGVSTEVGVHAETNDAGGTQFETVGGGTTGFSVFGNEAQFNVGVHNGGTGVKHARATPGCATTASVGATCTTVVSLAGTAFPDQSFTSACIGVGVTSGVPLGGGVTSRSTSSLTFQTVAATAAAAQYSEIDCIAIHD